jgi:serine/threonine protein kinase/Flp pilus assembly protein TadD
MTPDRWQQIDKLYYAVLELEPHERLPFLDQACGDDADVRREVESLLSSHDQAGNFLASPALEVAAHGLAKDQAGPLIARKSMIGQTLLHYRIDQKLGTGGMGEVYLAQDTKLGRKIALKLLPARLTQQEDRVRRFEREACAASALNHPNILTIYEIGRVDDTFFIATEFIDGQTLRQQMASKPITLCETLDVAIQVAKALAVAHEAGIVHRDIKPENIMVRRDGYVKVLDFGLAKLTESPATSIDSQASAVARFRTETGMLMGTTHYMSPEQARGQEVDGRSDIFSLGVVVYEMVTGKRPFDGATPTDVLGAILTTEPPQFADYSLEARPEIERVVCKALRKDPEQRYQSITNLLFDLENLKQELEWEAKQAGAHQYEAHAETGAITHQPLKKPPGADGARVGETLVINTTPSAKYLVTFLSRRKRAAILVLGAITAAVAWFSFSNRAPAITEKDTLLLADFVNSTGDLVFDGTLKEALAVQLEQTPFLNLFPEEGVREMLRYMGRSPDERVTKEVAREICQRQGIKAMIIGSITSLGRNYAITLETTSAQTGEVLARRQVEAEGKEQVLRALGRAATELREKLGESLPSIQKFDAPIEQATTSSLEALRAYSMGLEVEYRNGKLFDAIPFHKRAIELDNNFARAYFELAGIYSNTNQPGLWVEYGEKAFARRDRVSERERLEISAFYYRNVTGEFDKSLAVTELLNRTYPRYPGAHYLLGNWYRDTGEYEKAVGPYREASLLDSNSWIKYRNLGLALIRLDRFDEAKEVIDRALAQKLDGTGYHTQLYQIAFVRGDRAAMKQQLDWADEKPEEYQLVDLQAQALAYAGQQRQALELSAHAAELAQARDLKEPVARISVENALHSAIFGICLAAKENAARALAHSLREGATGFPVRPKAALDLALCGDVGQAQSLASEIALKYSQSTLSHAVWLPVIRAAVELRHNNADKAIQLLQAASQYEAIGEFWPTYLRGQAYVRLKKGTEAAEQFQKILDHRGWNPLSPLYPLAHLGQATASALIGDVAESRKGYQDFFALWKDADPDLPILLQAKRDYQKLR